MNSIISEDIQKISEEIKKEAALLEGKTLLVAGGSGFIGSYFLNVVSFLNENYFSKKCRIICLDNLISGENSKIEHLLSKDYFQFIDHDISTPLNYREEIDFVIHAASIASPTFYRKYPIETMDVNALGTRYLLQSALDKKIKSFLYLSSSEVYGDPSAENIPTPETYWGNVSCLGPRACYDESKRLAETFCAVFFNKYHLPVKIARPFNVYGPGLGLEDKRVVPDFINNALHRSPIIMYSQGHDTRSFCYIADAVKAFFKILLSDFNGEVFNVGNDLEETSMAKLAEVVNEISDNQSGVIREKSQEPNYLKDNPRRRCPDLTKIKRFLDYEPKVDLRTGLKRIIEWYKSTYNL